MYTSLKLQLQWTDLGFELAFTNHPHIYVSCLMINSSLFMVLNFFSLVTRPYPTSKAKQYWYVIVCVFRRSYRDTADHCCLSSGRFVILNTMNEYLMHRHSLFKRMCSSTCTLRLTYSYTFLKYSGKFTKRKIGWQQVKRKYCILAISTSRLYSFVFETRSTHY